MEHKILLNYFRCTECLSTFTSYETQIDVCVCDGVVEKLGQVRRDKTVFTEKERCACDNRCTSAVGPLCNCICGGENHGTGKMVTVIIELGKAKVKEINQEAIDKANEFREARSKAMERFEQKYNKPIDVNNNEWIQDRSLWYAMYTGKKAYKKACEYKVHVKRIKTLNGLFV